MTAWHDSMTRQHDKQSETVTFEHRHENKSCSACPSYQHKHLTYADMAALQHDVILPPI